MGDGVAVQPIPRLFAAVFGREGQKVCAVLGMVGRMLLGLAGWLLIAHIFALRGPNEWME